MIRQQLRKTDILQFRKLSEYKNIRHFISTNIKKEAQTFSNDLDISFNTGRSHSEILQNREILSSAAGIRLESFVMQDQVHSDNIKIIDENDKGKGSKNHKSAVQNNDAMITNEKGICLFIFAADCVPILIFDPVKSVIGAVHSGWKGTVKKIAQKTVNAMQREYGSRPEDLTVGIGPSISVLNYEIGENVVKEVENSFGTRKAYLLYDPLKEKYHMDLWYSNKKQLTEAGVQEHNIEISNLCTFDNQQLFFSARRSKKTGRFAAGIMLI